MTTPAPVKRSRLSAEAVLFSLFAILLNTVRSGIFVDGPLVMLSELLAPVVLFLVGLYWVADAVQSSSLTAVQFMQRLKRVLVLLVIVIEAVAPTILAMYARANSAPHRYVHDGLIQSEYATHYVLEGRNPYLEDYTDTPMADWEFRVGDLTENPALYHYPYLPVVFLTPLPLQTLSDAALGWFDQRVLYLVYFCLTLWLCTQLARSFSQQQLLLIGLGLNPVFIPYFVEGRNDIVVLFWLVLTAVLLQRDRLLPAALALAVACATKQTAWFFLPFYGLYLSKGDWASLREWGSHVKGPVVAFSALVLALLLPWFLWNPGAFLTDTITFMSSSGEGNYPINGSGFSEALVMTGLVASRTASFPFWLPQLAVGLPLLGWLLYRQWHGNTLTAALTHYAIWLFVTSFFFKSLSGNYLGTNLAILFLGSWITDPTSAETGEGRVW